MSKDDIGSMIQTATKNVSGGQPLSDLEKAAASNLAIHIKESQRNWYPIFVKELGLHKFELIGSALILEAVKIADLETIYCIQIDNSQNTENAIVNSQKAIEGLGGSGTGLDISPLLGRIDQLESTINLHSKSLENLLSHLHHLIPGEKEKDILAINKEDEQLLRAKLTGRIETFGEKRTDQFIEDIVKNRPFYNDQDFRHRVKLLRKPKKTKSSSPDHEKRWKSLVKQFEIDYSV